jgi:hypothetical protein
MIDRLDEAMAALAAAPTDRPLDNLEAEVVRRIVGRRARARLAAEFAPVGLSSVALALAIGLAAGSLTASAHLHTARHPNVFAVAESLAPSTLLEIER